MNIALILAGGLGLRMNRQNEPPKQFYKLGSRPVLIHTLDKFEGHNEIDAVCIVCLPGWETYLQKLVGKFKLKKVKWVVGGGDVRQQSVYNGLCAIEKDCSPDDIILIHDGVRPFITPEIISHNINVARKHKNAMTGYRCTDTLITSLDGIKSHVSMDRDSSYSVQTPQTYILGYGLEHYKRAYSAGITNSINCCELFIRMGEQVHIVNGLKTNIKLTTEEDILYLEYLHSIFHKEDNEQS